MHEIDDSLPPWTSALFGAVVCAAMIAGAFLGLRYLSPGTADAKIDGPAVVAAGEPVVFRADESTGQAFEWTPPAGAKSQTLDDGRRLVVVVPEGRHRVLLSVSSAAWGRLTKDTAALDFSTEAPGPDPAPPPGPKPPAPTPGPDGAHGMAKWAREQATALVTSKNRAAEARDIAAVLRSTSAEIAAGTLRSAMEAGSRADEQIDQRLGSAAPAWEGFRWAFLAKSKATFGAFPKLDDVAACFIETAEGLEAVK